MTKIIIVEDDGMIRQELQRFLSGEGYEVFCVEEFGSAQAMAE